MSCACDRFPGKEKKRKKKIRDFFFGHLLLRWRVKERGVGLADRACKGGSHHGEKDVDE